MYGEYSTQYNIKYINVWNFFVLLKNVIVVLEKKPVNIILNQT